VGTSLSVSGNSTLTGDLSVVGQTSLDQDLLVSGGIGVTNGISSDNYIILNNENELRFGDSGSNYVGFKGPAAAAGNIIWELPNSDGLSGQVLATDGFGNLSWIDPSLAAPVSSVYGRTGAVVAQAGDYTGAQVSNTPAGGIAATTVQTAINELDTEKANQSDLSALDTRVDTAETNITDLTTDLAATDAAVTAVEGRVTTAEGAITALDGRVTTNEGAITALDGRVTQTRVQSPLKRLISVHWIPEWMRLKPMSLPFKLM
jgi:hypothetical protein